MIKKYCDFCGKEITTNNEVRVHRVFKQKRKNVNKKLEEIKIEICNIYCSTNDICKDCIVDTIAANDNRIKN